MTLILFLGLMKYYMISQLCAGEKWRIMRCQIKGMSLYILKGVM